MTPLPRIISIAGRLLPRLAVVLGLTVLAGADSYAQVNDPSFEAGSATPPFTTYSTPSTFGGWTVGTNNIDLINGLWMAHSGNKSVDMNGFSGPASIYQDIATSPGQTYDLTFWMSGNEAFTKNMNVFFGAALVGSYSWTGDGTWSYQNMEWQLRTGSGLMSGAGSTTRLSFVSTTATCCQGPALDDVQLRLVTAIPEPASLALMGTALLGLLPYVRHRRKQ